jgi:hypothetical protein
MAASSDDAARLARIRDFRRAILQDEEWRTPQAEPLVGASLDLLGGFRVQECAPEEDRRTLADQWTWKKSNVGAVNGNVWQDTKTPALCQWLFDKSVDYAAFEKVVRQKRKRGRESFLLTDAPRAV